MKSNSSAIVLLLLGCSAALNGSDAPQVMRDEPVVLKPYVVHDKMFAEAGFIINARARKGSKAATGVVGIESFLIVISKPDPRTIAGRAGLKNGDKIIQIGEVKVDGLSFREFTEEFAKRRARLLVPLVISPKGSGELRSVVLDFGAPPEERAKLKEASQPPQPAR
jgi:predicted metalloprotease with PDZ domain